MQNIRRVHVHLCLGAKWLLWLVDWDQKKMYPVFDAAKKNDHIFIYHICSLWVKWWYFHFLFIGCMWLLRATVWMHLHYINCCSGHFKWWCVSNVTEICDTQPRLLQPLSRSTFCMCDYLHCQVKPTHTHTQGKQVFIVSTQYTRLCGCASDK